MIVEELRIGNWVSNIHNIPMIVKAISENTVYVDFKGNAEGLFEFDKQEPFKPIPLTKEILLKCGFELKGIIFRINNGLANQFNVNYSPSRNIYYYDSSRYGIYTEVEIKHLHQLQNLYFALTNEELNIQL